MCECNLRRCDVRISRGRSVQRNWQGRGEAIELASHGQSHYAQASLFSHHDQASLLSYHDPPSLFEANNQSGIPNHKARANSVVGSHLHPVVRTHFIEAHLHSAISESDLNSNLSTDYINAHHAASNFIRTHNWRTNVDNNNDKTHTSANQKTGGAFDRDSDNQGYYYDRESDDPES